MINSKQNIIKLSYLLVVFIVICGSIISYKYLDDKFIFKMAEKGYIKCNPGISVYTTWVNGVSECSKYKELFIDKN